MKDKVSEEIGGRKTSPGNNGRDAIMSMMMKAMVYRVRNVESS